MTDREPDVMTAEEAADYLRISLRTFKALRAAGEGPPGARIGRQWRFRRTALDQWLAEREATGPAGGSNRHDRHETGLRADDEASSGQTAS